MAELNVNKEREEMSSFLRDKARNVFIEHSNGRKELFDIDDFFVDAQEGHLEHKEKNIIINLFKGKYSSYSYLNDSRGEIIDREPFCNVAIL